ncbi:carbohydrate ABC transporter permease [Mesoplasma lactucae]|uniref:Uncharacterized protein n=1 Tax=Mesoplasma lactucae ATCC 49193 TaxID=81460 RepID=A0A291IQY1_9MOLU|nr:carbohydrate ABC transporter permease [Mesoplasma lactucae]ATG97150.1 hypothetical protein CP520_00010 [Mesoplasma lactucae ATCC 49193]ATZ20411.1 sn-glycerol-3-phosphate ABC transporter permease [Mesoplasma lactucae ATCC 49193]MCL8216582.1 hypothetical protein [Mesoplasma lactucae ATCC 49193]
MRKTNKKYYYQVALILILALVALVILLPMLYMVFNSFKSFEELGTSRGFFPKTWDTKAYEVLFKLTKENNSIPTWQYFTNSLWITTIMMIGQTIMCALAGFGLYYWRTKFNVVIEVLFMAIMTIPGEALLLGRFIQNTELGWQNMALALIVPFLGNVYGIYQFRSMFYRLSRNTKRAAIADGMKPGAYFWMIAIPAIMPAIVTNFITGFITAWNAVLWPILVLEPGSKYATVPVLMYYINTMTADQLNKMQLVPNLNGGVNLINLKMATATLSVAPLFVGFVLLNKPLMKGILKQWKS